MGYCGIEYPMGGRKPGAGDRRRVTGHWRAQRRAFPSWRALNANFHTAEWVILAYQIASMVPCVGIGRFADIVGYRRVFLYGAMLFTALLMAPRGG